MRIISSSAREVARGKDAENNHSGPEIILQKQYRPPIDKVVIEGPAGLIDAGETAEHAALRELKEETGYVGVVTQTSPVMFNGEPDASIYLDPCNDTEDSIHRPWVLQYESQNCACHGRHVKPRKPRFEA